MEQTKGFENATKRIELDCPPGPRPDVLIPGIIEGTGLKEEDFRNTSRSFGNWEFELNPEKNALYEQHHDTIVSRIKALYPSRIRYASWS